MQRSTRSASVALDTQRKRGVMAVACGALSPGGVTCDARLAAPHCRQVTVHRPVGILRVQLMYTGKRAFRQFRVLELYTNVVFDSCPIEIPRYVY